MKKYSLSILAIILFLSCDIQKDNRFQIGQKSKTYIDQSRNRPLVTEIWYPTFDSLIKKESKNHRKELFETIINR